MLHRIVEPNAAASLSGNGDHAHFLSAHLDVVLQGHQERLERILEERAARQEHLGRELLLRQDRLESLCERLVKRRCNGCNSCSGDISMDPRSTTEEEKATSTWLMPGQEVVPSVATASASAQPSPATGLPRGSTGLSRGSTKGLASTDRKRGLPPLGPDAPNAEAIPVFQVEAFMKRDSYTAARASTISSLPGRSKASASGMRSMAKQPKQPNTREVGFRLPEDIQETYQTSSGCRSIASTGIVASRSAGAVERSSLLRDARVHWRKLLEKKRASTLNLGNIKDKKDMNVLERMITSRRYELFVLALVILNAGVLGIQVQYTAYFHEPPSTFIYLETAFCAIFTVELMLRFVVHGPAFVWKQSSDSGWNRFDALVICLMVFEQILQHGTSLKSSFISQMGMLRVLRIIRIVRVIRIIRMLKFFRELRMMLYSILGSLKSLVWAMLVLMIMFYIFGISLCQGAIDWFAEHGWSKSHNLYRHFGTLDRTVLSLFEAMAGGISWGELVDILAPLHWTYTGIFLVFISCAIFAVVNVVTGVFVENAMQTSQADKEAIIQEEVRSKELLVDNIYHIFAEMDENKTGNIGLEEFNKAVQDQKLVAFFNALRIEITDVETLFILLDGDGSGQISIEEFLVGCMRLRGEARSLDLAKLSAKIEFETEWMIRSMDSLLTQVRGMHFSLINAGLISQSASSLATGRSNVLAACGDLDNYRSFTSNAEHTETASTPQTILKL